MQTRELGRSGLHISPLMLGGNVFGWTVDEATSFAVLDAFVAGGGNAIDTADSYSVWVPGHVGGESETIIGKWLQRRGRRDDVVIATKVGWEVNPDQERPEKGLHPARRGGLASPPGHRLRIDLYQSHNDDPTTSVAKKPSSAYAQLVKAGKVRAIGASNFTAARLQRVACRPAPRTASRATRRCKTSTTCTTARISSSTSKPLLLQERIGVHSVLRLAAGFLTGKYRAAADLQKSPRGAGVGQKYLNDKGLALLLALDAVADRQQATPAQVALAWLMQAPAVTAPIASATSVGQVTELLEATELRLTAEDLATLENAQAVEAAE